MQSIYQKYHFVCELESESSKKDAFGHKELAGCSTTLAHIIKERTGLKVRPIILSTLQRASAHTASLTDMKEAEKVIKQI